MFIVSEQKRERKTEIIGTLFPESTNTHTEFKFNLLFMAYLLMANNCVPFINNVSYFVSWHLFHYMPEKIKKNILVMN